MASGRKDWEADYGDIFEPEEEITLQQRARTTATPLRVAVVVGSVVLLLLYVVVSRQFDPPGEPAREVVVQIPGGMTTTGIAHLLEDEGVVPSQLALRIWIRLKSEGNFHAGEYTFHRNSSTGQALSVLNSGPDLKLDRITIPEGFRVDQIAGKVGRLQGMSAVKFREITESGLIRSSFQPATSTSLEGFLFPDTYLLSPSDTEETLVRRMVNQFDTIARITNLDQAPRAIQQPPYDALIIASMIESEAKVPQDRGKISQVIQNRIARDMHLQIDATVLYALGNDRQALTVSDLAVESPYNTYLHKGLPPAPISNSGRASIEAALQPEPGPWLYYVVTEASGAHSFATTFEEHQRNIAIARARGFVGS